MRILLELQNITFNVSNSESSFCYTADLHLNGNLIVQVANDGSDKPDEIVSYAPGIDDAFMEQLDRDITEHRAANNLPVSWRWFCHQAVENHAMQARLETTFERSWLFYPDGLPTLSNQAELKELPYGDAPSDENRATTLAHIEATWPDAYILNRVPIAEAIAAYRLSA